MPRRVDIDSDSDSSSSDTSDTESDGFDSSTERKAIKKYTRKHGQRSHVGKSNNKKHGSNYLRLTTQGVDQFASTPSSIFEELCARYAPAFGEKTLFDPCPEFYDKKTGGRINKPGYNGLEEDWGKINYVNPPYGQIKHWFPKAIEQQAKGNTSVFLVPLRPFTAYFVKTSPHISWAEVIYYGVGFKGYSGKIPHPMCNIVFLGKGVKDRPEFHMTVGNVPNNKKINNFPGAKNLTVKLRKRKYTYIQKVPKPCAFDNATEICRNHGIPESRIHIMINSSNMVESGYLDKDRMARARKEWKHSYALLVPFYNYSVAFQIGMREATILAYSSPILCNYAGEGKCRFCSVLFVFCPTKHKNFKAMISQPNLHPFKMYFNFNGYMPTLEELAKAKLKKIQATKAAHMSKQRGVMGRKMAGGKKSSVRSKSAKKAAKKPARKTSAKKPAKKSGKKASAKKASAKRARSASAGRAKPEKSAGVRENWKKVPKATRKDLITRWVSRFFAQHGKLPTETLVKKHFGGNSLDFKRAVFDVMDQAWKKHKPSNRKRNAVGDGGRPAKKQKLMASAGSPPRNGYSEIYLDICSGKR